MTARMSLTAQMLGDALVERYRYLSGPASSAERHVHEHWQWCLYVGGPGSYVMRKGRIVFPSGTLTVLAPGELHAARDPQERMRPTTCLVLYLPPEQEPAVRGPVVDSPRARRAFARLWSAHEHMEAEVALGGFLASVGSAGQPNGFRRAGAPGLRAAREYLHEHASDRVTLAELAAVSGLSSAHLVRAFGRAYGLAPHRYQTVLRIDRAKRLLMVGQRTISEVAHTLGFADHAHFTRTFRRWVGTSPSAYAKNVQDSGRSMRLDGRP
jgi:AraC-like DNA-binding protein